MWLGKVVNLFDLDGVCKKKYVGKAQHMPRPHESGLGAPSGTDTEPAAAGPSAGMGHHSPQLSHEVGQATSGLSLPMLGRSAALTL